MKRTQVQLEEELYELLRQEAFERGVSISELVRSILRQHRMAGGEPQGSLGFVGMGESEQGSLAPVSERHDEALEEVILLDTSAIYAPADRGDPNHRGAVERLRQLEAQGHTLFVHSYILVESTALLQRRLGLAVALRFLEDARAFRIHWVISRDHEEAVRLLTTRGKPTLSLVDCVSFVRMKRYGIITAFAFDEDFEREGFQLLK